MKHNPPADISLALWIGGGSLLAIAFLLRMYCRRRRTRFHSPLDVSSVTLSENIARRKLDLQRFIHSLQRQLANRQQQLEMHDRVEQVLTTREMLESPPSDDRQWVEIMRRGKEMYQDEWEVGENGNLPLGVLFNMHKEELLATARATPRQAASSHAKDIERQNQATLLLHEAMQTSRQQSVQGASAAAVIPAASQWKSQRRVGTTSTPMVGKEKAVPAAVETSSIWSHHRFPSQSSHTVPQRQPPSPVPRLNLTALAGTPSPPGQVVSIKDIFKRLQA
ncbi:hypothetical protein H310_09957 [Aphanomyces invadans]|uniref:Uncharacterized protein n=1 Tax=Aphanomyces invadans TaxID=157072 RepID=A0A024TUY0_9STRA|nr:hypothetical protein H310_09957 [Aphanomyces invadans]ETV97157.1 hypothetical protein H310_09957 [Aphanomyces invadans]|eukprot:XP_008874403.1 hypothetical protein H310_09957 [Aphanomyces invadans]